MLRNLCILFKAAYENNYMNIQHLALDDTVVYVMLHKIEKNILQVFLCNDIINCGSKIFREMNTNPSI